MDALCLSETQQRILRDIVASVRGGGPGIGVLFAGAGGEKKAVAAEVIARETGLDLYRVDLAQVVGKSIRETEKNLRRVFEAAGSTGNLLLFDEADALFGKRTEVKESPGYLLQLMEAHRGGIILAAKTREMLDQAFLNRVCFIVDFD